MGSILSYISSILWDSGPDEPHPTTGLTKRDVANVRSSWELANKDPIATGCELLIRYFNQYPEAKKHFHSFREVPNEELRTNRQFHAHCLSIMSWFTTAISHFDTPDLVLAMAEKAGQNHNRRKVQQQDFKNIRKVLEKLLVDALQINEETQESWNKALTFMLTPITDSLLD